MKVVLFGAAAFVVCGFLFFGSVARAALAPAPSPCDTIGTPFLTITQRITNDPDSGVHGDWAVDAFTENIAVWVASNGTYCANASTTNGTFVTTGPLSPEEGNQLPAGIVGTFTGGENYVIPSGTSLNPLYSTTSTQAITLPDSSTAGFSWWVNQVFPSIATSSGSSYVQTYSLTYVTPNGSTWTDADSKSGGDTGDINAVFDTTTGLGYATLQEAITAANSSDTIVLGADATTTSQVNITKAMTIDGGGHTIYADFTKTSNSNNSAIGITGSDVTIENLTIDGSGGTNLHGINVYEATDVTVDNVTIKNNSNGAAMIVNGSNVTATNLNTSGNSWGAVNVDPGSGVKTPSVFTLNSGTLAESNQIWSDGSNVTSTATVTVTAPGYDEYAVGGQATPYFMWMNKTPSNAAVVTENGISTIYSTIQAAVNAASAGDTVSVGAGTYAETVNVNKPITLEGAQNGIAGEDHSGSESTVKGFNITTSSVIIDGFSLSNAGVQLNVTSPTTLSGIVVRNNVFSGYQSVGFPTSNAGNILIEYNLFKNATASSESMQIKSNSGNPGGCDGTQVLNNVFTAATNNGGADVNFSCTGSDSSDVTISGNTSMGISGGSSFVAFSGVDGDITVTHNTASTDGSAIFFFGNVNGTALISDNSITNGSSSAVSIHGGDITSDIANTGTFTITNNNFSNNARGIYVAASAISTGGTVIVHGNTLTGNNVYGVDNESTSTTVDATNNYWGTVSSTAIASMTYGGVNYTPWSNGLGSETNVEADAPEVIIGSNATSSTSTVNVPEDATSTTLNASALLDTTNDSVTLPGAITVNATTSIGNVNVQIPAGIKITGTSGWTGIINVPQVKANNTVSVTPDVNHGASISSVIEIGSNSTPLTFDQAVRILMAGQGGKYVGYYRNGTFTPITTLCSADTQSAGNSLSAGGDCKIDVNNGADLVVWTKHFTSFVTYTQYVTSVTTYATGGGGGGGGYIAPLPAATAPATTVTQPATTLAAPAVGQVLGAQAFRFTEDLSEGMQNDNVTELQNRLTSEGVYSGPATGYFGPLTLAGVKEYQAKHNLPTTGFVGPMTRAELNAALTSAASQGQVLGAQTTGTAETIARIQGIIQQLQAEGGQEKIISVLQMVLAFLGQ